MILILKVITLSENLISSSHVSNPFTNIVSRWLCVCVHVCVFARDLKLLCDDFAILCSWSFLYVTACVFKHSLVDSEFQWSGFLRTDMERDHEVTRTCKL